MFKVKVKKLHPDAKMPSFANATDAGMDIYAIEDEKIKSGEYKLIKTGISIELPSRTEAQVRPKSGLALKYGVTLLNTPGTIDEDYRGEIGVIMINHGSEEFIIEKGMKIAQLVVKPTYEVELSEVTLLSDTERGEGGFGSTGRW